MTTGISMKLLCHRIISQLTQIKRQTTSSISKIHIPITIIEVTILSVEETIGNSFKTNYQMDICQTISMVLQIIGPIWKINTLLITQAITRILFNNIGLTTCLKNLQLMRAIISSIELTIGTISLKCNLLTIILPTKKLNKSTGFIWKKIYLKLTRDLTTEMEE